MKKGFAVEGYIQQDGTIRPLEHYDDTELREKIQNNTNDIENLDGRVTALEEGGGGGGGEHYEELLELINKRIEKPIIAFKDRIAIWDADKGLKMSDKKVTDLAPVRHPHVIEDVEGLEEELAKSAPVDVCLFEDSRVQGGPYILPTDPQDVEIIGEQDIDMVVGCLKDIIRHVCAEHPDLNANVYLRAKTYKSYQESYDELEKDATMVHVYTTLHPSASELNVDFHIELLERDTVWYTVVEDIHKTSDNKNVSFEDATFAEFWELYTAVPEKDLHAIYDKMSFTPKNLTIATDERQAQIEDRFVLNRASTINLWLACSIGKCYKVKVLFEGREKNYEVLCTAIASGTGSNVPVLKLYFGLHTLELQGDGEFTADQIRSGQVSPSEVGWDVVYYDNTPVFAGLQ